jgi:hypothetical protein
MKRSNWGAMGIVVMMAIAIAFVSVRIGEAQRRIRLPRVENPDVRDSRPQESLERSAALERAGTDSIRTSEPDQLSPRQRRMLIIAQIKEDFGRIQDLHQDMVSIADNGETLDYKRISETTEKIKQRAIRLKDNLALPESEERAAGLVPVPVDYDQVRESISKLSDSILEFVANPLMSDSDVIDAEYSTKANRDLKRIIQLSGNIKKFVDRLQKTAKHTK